MFRTRNPSTLIFLLLVLPFTVVAQDQRPSPAPKMSPPRVRPLFYTVKAGKTIRVRMNESISSKSARVGDTFTTTTVDPIYASGGVEVIPAGSIIGGRVSAVKKAGKKGAPGWIDVAFNRLELPNGTKRVINGSLVDLNADNTTSDVEGRASGSKMKNRKIVFVGGGAGTGAIIGGIIGGGKGAAIGAGIGAVSGILGDRLLKGPEAEVKSGTEFSVVLNLAVSLPANR